MAPNVLKTLKIIFIIVFVTKPSTQLISVSEMKMILIKFLPLLWKIISKDMLKIPIKKIVTFYSDQLEPLESKDLTLMLKLPISQLDVKQKNTSI